jgi:DNA modification methylase
MILNADALHIPLANGTVQTCVTSPPYFGLRNYNVDGQIGLEETPELYVEKLVAVFREVWRVLADTGTCWINLGDSYAGTTPGQGGKSDKQTTNKGSFFEINRAKDRTSKRWGGGGVPATDGLKPKDLIGIPWMVAFALRADGWYLRSEIIWHKPNPMPESVTDRPTKSHEQIFLLSKSPRYFYDADAIKEEITSPSSIARNRSTPRQIMSHASRDDGVLRNDFGRTYSPETEAGRNKRDVWTVNTKSYAAAHFATFPPKLIEPCILAGSREGDIVLDPFSGSGTTGEVSIRLRRRYVGLELNMDYIALQRERTTTDVMLPLFVGSLT